MTYKDIGFRGVYHNFIVVEMTDTIKKISDKFPYYDKANCVLTYGYIDHSEGTTLEVLACGSRSNNKFEFFDSLDDTRVFIRIGAVENAEMTILDNTDKRLETRYADRLEVVKEYDADNELTKTRLMDFLDPSRHDHYPDDIQLYLQTKDENIELCWLRIEGADDSSLYGTLLNEPIKECNCHAGDVIEFFMHKTEDGRFICVSEGKKRQFEAADESMLKAAIKRFEDDKTKENLISILDILRDILIWIPCNAVISDADIDKFKEAKEGMTIQSTDDIRMIPDILQNGDEYFFPVFTSNEEMGEYGQHFSKIEKWFLEAITLAFNNEKKVSGIVINAFTNPFVLTNDLLELIQEQGSHFNVEEQ